MLGSGASRLDHVHLQGYLREQPLPIERASRSPWYEAGGVIIERLEGYPIYGLCARGPKVVEAVFAMKAALQAERPAWPFNLVLTGGTIIFIPRVPNARLVSRGRSPALRWRASPF